MPVVNFVAPSRWSANSTYQRETAIIVMQATLLHSTVCGDKHEDSTVPAAAVMNRIYYRRVLDLTTSSRGQGRMQGTEDVLVALEMGGLDDVD